MSTPSAHKSLAEGEASPADQPRGLRLVESWIVVVLLGAMTVLPTLETIGRRLFDKGIPGSSVLTQHLTLWVGFLGALLATGAGKHLALSTVEMLPEGKPRHIAKLVGDMVATAVCALFAYAAWKLCQADFVNGRVLPGGVKVFYSELIMPVATGLMALRFAWRTEYGWRGRALCLAAAIGAFTLGLVSTHAALIWPVAILILVAFLIGTPVFVAMAGLAMLLFFKDGTPIASVPVETFRLVASSHLPAIPLLTLAGYVLAEGGAAKRLVGAYRGILGWMPGGLSVMAVFVCAIFTTFTGASGVTILALGGLILPSLLEEGYPEGFSLGLVTAAGSLGLLFPPSLPVILYGVVAEVPIDLLFIGGLVPGILMILLVAAYGIYTGVRTKAPRQPFNGRDAAKAFWAAKWDLGLPVLVIVAVASGFATVVEAAALAAAYAIIVELAIFRDIDPIRDLPRVFTHAATLVGSVVILLGVALGLTSYLVDAEIPTMLIEWVTTHIKQPWIFLLALNVILLVLGSVLEVYSAIVVLAPLLAPMGAAYGIDPVHLGVVFLANLELGFLFPPMGLNLFLSATRFQKPLPYLYKKAFPFLIIMTIGVLLITYVPAITTGIVTLVKK